MFGLARFKHPRRIHEVNALPKTDWTLLVQGVNLHSDAADALLRRFAFLPYARLDDLMVSYAAPGGGVEPGAAEEERRGGPRIVGPYLRQLALAAIRGGVGRETHSPAPGCR